MKDHLTHSQIFLTNLTVNPKVKTVGKKRNWGTPPNLQHFKGIRVCWNSGMEIKMSDKRVNYSHGLTQTKQQVG
jgi:hypothetical protein